MPMGGWGMIERGPKAIGREVEGGVRETFTTYRKTHNATVFDMYTREIRDSRRSHIITGLPDACGRGRTLFSGACGNPAILAYANKLAPTDRPDIGYAMIFPGMTIVKILFVDIIPAFFRL